MTEINGIDVTCCKMAEINAIVKSSEMIQLTILSAVQETNIDAMSNRPDPARHAQTPSHPSMARIMELSRTPSERKSSVVDGIDLGRTPSYRKGSTVDGIDLGRTPSHRQGSIVDGVQGLRNSAVIETRVDEGGLDLSPGPRESSTDQAMTMRKQKPEVDYCAPNPDYNSSAIEPESAYDTPMDISPQQPGYQDLSLAGSDEEEFDEPAYTGDKSVYEAMGTQVAKPAPGSTVYDGTASDADSEDFDEPTTDGAIYSQSDKQSSADGMLDI